MSCGCIKGGMKTKFLSKLNCFHSSKKAEQKEATLKKNQTTDRTKPGQGRNANSSRKDDTENYLELSTGQVTLEPNIRVSLTEIIAEEEKDRIGSLKTIESKSDISSPAARRPSAVGRIRGFLKPKSRRDAICDEMERNVENSGLSLRQYRKFLATASVLQELKMI